MIRRNKSFFALLFLLCIRTALPAQQFGYSAPLDSVTKTGFYQLGITPQIAAHVKTDFADLRIADEKGKWVPHIIKPALPPLSQSALKEFPIISNQQNDSGKTVLVLENKGMGLRMNNKEVLDITEIVLFIKNTLVNRYATLSGSNDQKNWYIISENIWLNRSYVSDSNYFISAVKFGNTDYKYFKLVIDNQKSDPLNIYKCGTYFNLNFKSPPINWADNPEPAISQKDSSDGKTYVKVHQGAAYHMDGLLLDISGAKFYKRRAALYLPQQEGSAVLEYIPECAFTISSGSSNEFSIKTIQATTFYIVIENYDNPPLQITAVHTRQTITNLVAWLEQGKKYSLLAGNAMATPPDYDIAAFKDSIPAQVPAIGVGAFSKTTTVAAVQKNTRNKWWLWPAIIGAIAVLGFLSWKLMADMKKSDA